MKLTSPPSGRSIQATSNKKARVIICAGFIVDQKNKKSRGTGGIKVQLFYQTRIVVQLPAESLSESQEKLP